MTKARYTHALLLESPKKNGWQLLKLSGSLRRLQLHMEKLEALWMEARRLWIVEVTQEAPPRRKTPKRKPGPKQLGPALPFTRAQLRALRRVWDAEGTLPYWHLAKATLGALEGRGLVENVHGKLMLTDAGMAVVREKNGEVGEKHVVAP